MKTEMAKFPLNMTNVFDEADMKRKWLDFRQHDNIVVGFDMKTEMAEFRLNITRFLTKLT